MGIEFSFFPIKTHVFYYLLYNSINKKRGKHVVRTNEPSFWKQNKFSGTMVSLKNEQWANDLDLSEKWKNYSFLSRIVQILQNKGIFQKILKKMFFFNKRRILGTNFLKTIYFLLSKRFYLTNNFIERMILLNNRSLRKRKK